MLLITVPKLSRVAVLLNPTNAGSATALKIVQDAAQMASVMVLPMEARTPQEIENAFSMMAKRNAGAVVLAADGFIHQQARQIAELALKFRLPSISSYWQYAEVGGLMSYGQNLGEYYRRAAIYVDKIFKGAKPGDLPIEQPTIIEMLINGKTAKALGLTVPKELLVRADRVIE